MDFYVITMDDGYTEELEIEDCKQWFKDRGANMDAVDRALDHTWNFRRAEIVIRNPKEPLQSKLPYSPKL